MSYDIGPKIGIEGEAAFKQSIAAVNAQLKNMGAEMKAVVSAYDAGDKSTEALTAKNEVLGRSMDTVRQKIEVLQGQYDKQKVKLTELGDALESATNEYGANSAEALAAQNAYNRQATQVSKLGEQLNGATASLNRMGQELSQNEQDLENVSRGYNEAGQKLDEFGGVIKDTEGKASSWGNALAKAGTMAAKAIAAAGAAIAAAMGAALTASIKFGSEFETSMAKASTLFGDVNVNSDELNQKMIALSSSTGVAASELGESLYNALSAGIPATEDMSEAVDFLDSSTKLAKAGFTDVDTAMSATVKTMNAYGLGVEEADRIQKVLIQTQNKGITTVGELGSVLAQVTPTAAAMGVQFEQVGAGLAVMTAQGTPAAQATTQLNSLFAELGKNGTVAQKSLASATDGTKYAGKSFQELMEAGVPLNEVLGLIRDSADKSGLSMLDMFSSVEAGKAALSMTGENASAFTDALASMSTEADVVGAAYEKVSNTFAENSNKIKNTAKNLGIAIYQDIDGPLADTTKSLSGMMDSLLAAFQDGGFDALVGQVGKVLGQLSGMIVQALPQAIEAGLQIAGSIGQGIIDALPQLLEGAALMIQTLVEGIGLALPTLIPAALEAVTTIIRGLVSNIPMLVGAALQLVQGLADGILAAIPVLLEALPEIIISLVNALLESIPQIIETGVQLLTALVQALPEIIAAIVAVLPDIIDGIVTALLDNLPLIIQAGIDLLTALVQNLPTIIITIVKAIPQIISSIIDALTSNIPLLVQAGIQLFVALVENLPAIIVGIVKAVPEIITAIVEGFLGLAGSIVDVGENIIKGVWTGIKNMAGWIKDKVTGFFSGIVDGVKDFLGIHSPSRAFATIGEQSMKGFSVGMEDEGGNTIKTAKKLSDDIAKAAAMAGKKVEGISVPVGIATQTANALQRAVGGVQQANSAAIAAGITRPAYTPAGNVGATRSTAVPSAAVPPINLYLTVKSELDGAVLARKLYPYSIRQGRIQGESLVKGTV